MGYRQVELPFPGCNASVYLLANVLLAAPQHQQGMREGARWVPASEFCAESRSSAACGLAVDRSEAATNGGAPAQEPRRRGCLVSGGRAAEEFTAAL